MQRFTWALAIAFLAMTGCKKPPQQSNLQKNEGVEGANEAKQATMTFDQMKQAVQNIAADCATRLFQLPGEMIPTVFYREVEGKLVAISPMKAGDLVYIEPVTSDDDHPDLQKVVWFTPETVTDIHSLGATPTQHEIDQTVQAVVTSAEAGGRGFTFHRPLYEALENWKTMNGQACVAASLPAQAQTRSAAARRWPFECGLDSLTDDFRSNFNVKFSNVAAENNLYRWTNKCFRLNEYDAPSDSPGQPDPFITQNNQMRDNLYALMGAANSQLSEGDRLQVLSAFRSFQTQIGTFNNWVNSLGWDEAIKVSAYQGHSEHQTGYAIDFTTRNLGGSPWGLAFYHTAAYRYLDQNAHNYGFVLSYPIGKESITCYSPEPWHWRFVGRDLAMHLKSSNKTFEEYARSQLGREYSCPNTGSLPTPPPGGIRDFKCPAEWNSKIATCINSDLTGFCSANGGCAQAACGFGKVFECKDQCQVGPSGGHDNCNLPAGGTLANILEGTQTAPPAAPVPDCTKLGIMMSNVTTCVQESGGSFQICTTPGSCLAMACKDNARQACNGACMPGPSGQDDICVR